MEAKGVRVPLGIMIMVVLILGLNLAQTHVEAKSCCPSTSARNIYNVCRLAGTPRPTCASLSGCKIVDGKCPNGWDKLYFCKSGCASSMCPTINTLEGSDVAEEAVVACNNKCSELCKEGYNEGSTNAVFTA